MSNKGNFSQAMREILGLDSQNKQKENEFSNVESQNSAASTDSNAPSSDRLNKDFSQTFSSGANATNATNAQTAEAQDNTYEQPASKAEEKAFFEKQNYNNSTQSTFTGNYKADSARFAEEFKNTAGNGMGEGGFYEEEEEPGTTIITRNTVIEGNIKSFENIELNGRVKGTIDTTKNVGVSGFVQGDIQATDVLLEGAQIKGNINSKGALLMDKDTLLVGDVAAQNTRVDGKIKGEINVGGNGEFLSNSVVVGNITVSNFYVQYGARMQGYINTNFSQNEEESIFGQISGN